MNAATSFVKVEIVGPSLFGHALCALLHAFPWIVAAYSPRDIQELDSIRHISPKEALKFSAVFPPYDAVFPELALLVARHPAVPAFVNAWVLGSTTVREAAANGRVWPQGRNLPVQVLLCAEDEPATFYEGIIAAAEDRPYCSPRLAGIVPVAAVAAAGPARTSGHMAGAERAVSATPGRIHPVAAASPFDDLSPREAEIAALAARGFSNGEIAARLFIGVTTVKSHFREIFRKLKIRHRTQLGGLLLSERHDPGRGVDKILRKKDP